MKRILFTLIVSLVFTGFVRSQCAPNCTLYTINSIPLAISPSVGTQVTLSDDQVSAACPIGFTFTFMCNAYTNFYISSNGFISFNAAVSQGCCSGQVIPSPGNAVNDMIAFSWNDFYPPGAPVVPAITYTTIGTAPNRTLIVTYTNVPHCCNNGPAFNSGQIKLMETTNVIQIHSSVVTNDGSTATQGIMNAAGTIAYPTTAARNGAIWTSNGDAYELAPTPGLPNCSGTPTAGTSQASQTTACAAYTTQLSLIGSVQQCNLTYQWQSAPALAGPWTNIAGATASVVVVTQAGTSTFYRCVVTCGGVSATSVPVNCVIPPCVGIPVAGTAVASPTIGCTTINSNLSLTGTVAACGLTYQWQSATNIGGPYTNIVGATQITAAITATVTSYFRCVVSCGGNSANSAAATISITPGPCCSVNLDATANANGAASFNITTTQPNELIMISYDGWNGPGTGPVTVDGNPATLVAIANNGNSGTSEVYAYAAAAAGVHSIVCNENGYSYPPYGINFAASFYGTGCALTLASIDGTVVNTIACTTGGSIQANITTLNQNEMIYCNAEINNGQAGNYPILWTNANFIASLHIGNGIDAGHGYSAVGSPGTYSIVATNTSLPNNGCGGLTVILVSINPCVCVQLLPIEMEKFGCTPSNGGMLVNWITASESRSSHFTIERSYDGIQYIPIAKLPAAGTSKSRKEYSYLDKDARSGNNYYRLVETDLDGHSDSFEITECELSNTSGISMYPNPNTGTFELMIETDIVNGELKVTNALGKIVSVQKIVRGSNKVNLSGLSKGIYQYSVVQDNKSLKTGKIALE